LEDNACDQGAAETGETLYTISCKSRPPGPGKEIVDSVYMQINNVEEIIYGRIIYSTKHRH